MKAQEVKHHFKKFFGYDLPQTQINVFSPEFIEFCLYISKEQIIENTKLKARLDTNRAQVKAMATEKRRRTQRALDVCPACAGKGNIQIGVYSETCSSCHGTGTRQ